MAIAPYPLCGSQYMYNWRSYCTRLYLYGSLVPHSQSHALFDYAKEGLVSKVTCLTYVIIRFERQLHFFTFY